MEDWTVFMREALAEADRAAAMDEAPIGAVVVKDGRIVARGHNRREVDRDPTAHAEMLAIRDAARVLGDWRLEGCDLYVTLEPCMMCAGAIVLARVPRLIYGAADSKAGACGTLYNIVNDSRLNHRVEVIAGVMAEEACQRLQKFFRGKRTKD